MKKLIYTLVFVLIVNCILKIEDCQSQWQSDVRLTNDPAISKTSFDNARCIASSGSVVHVVWYDNRDGNEEIYYKRSTNSGTNWGSDTRLTNNSSGSNNPSVSLSGSVVHIVWYDNRDGNNEIYYKRSTDAGVSWGTDTRLTNNSSSSFDPSVAVSGSVVHVVWHDYRTFNNEIYYKRSSDAGVSWSADSALTNNTANSNNSHIAVYGSMVHVAWTDVRDGNDEIYYKRSTDAGVSWGIDTRLTNNTSVSNNSSLSVSGMFVYVAWQDNRDGNWEIYYKSSNNEGTTWGADTRLTSNTSASYSPSILVIPVAPAIAVHVVWYDNRDGNFEIYYKYTLDGGNLWNPDTRLTNSTNDSQDPSVAVSGTAVNVVWCDYRDGNWEIYYKRNPTGNPAGIINISSEIPSSYSLQQNYPNPFNQSSIINFQCAIAGNVNLKVYDLLGSEVAVLVNEYLQGGTYQVRFDAKELSSGMYLYRINSSNFSETKKLIIIK